MKAEHRDVSLPSIASLASITGLAGATGGLVAGLRGLQAGCVAGIVIALLPFLADRVSYWLTRPDGLPRFVAREIGRGAISIAAPLVQAIVGPVAAIARLLHGPAVLALVVGSILADVTATTLGRIGRTIATPLGAANLAALLVIAIDLIGLSFAPLAIGAGLIALVLVLLVTMNEAETGDPAC
ncbi:MAG: hypothetical protein JSR90_19005 [Proteobacteria bacterium]|nr:hypothetical protein [Pseudomonadota bacterium]